MVNCNKIIEDVGVLPVINITQLEQAVPLAKVLMEEGICAIEVTLRSECSLDAIKIIKENYPEMAVGAGTVLTIEKVDLATAAGADFIVMPGYDDEIIDYCIKKNIPVFPGCVTAAEIQKGIKKGLKVFKFFPAEQNGGTAALTLLSGPFAGVKFLPTGGINFGNLESYLSKNFVIACGGSYMATSEQLKNNDFDGIRVACRKAVELSLGFKLAHVGINNPDEQEAVNGANTLADVFGFKVKNGNSSVFADKYVEFMKMPFYGEKGHIGFYTNSVKRAMAYFERNNISIDYDSIRKDTKDELVSFYLKNQVNGFAVHVVRK